MAELKFPFWIGTQRRGLITKPVEPEGMQGFAATFSSAEELARFMVARGETVWENRLVTGNATLSTLLRDLRQIGMKGFCINPNADGGGVTVAFEELEI